MDRGRLVVLVIAGVAFALLLSVAQHCRAVSAPADNEAKPQTPPNLFDYDQFRRLFGKDKTAASLVERSARSQVYMSRALNTYLAAAKYRLRVTSWYLAIHDKSDWTQAELDMMRNKVLEEAGGEQPSGLLPSSYGSKPQGNNESDEQMPELALEPGEDIVAGLKRALETHKGEPNYEQLKSQLDELGATRGDAASSRKKRSTDAPVAKPEPLKRGPRDLPVAKLIHSNPDVRLSAKTLRKMGQKIKSNNPFYAGTPELMTEGMRDQQKKLTLTLYHSLVPKSNMLSMDLIEQALRQLQSKYSRDVFHDALSSFPDLEGTVESDQGDTASDPTPKPDEVFADLRNEDCLFLPRDQHQCGACYAFASVALMEFLHCKQTGKLVAFSEQYPIDCGPQYVANDRLSGCGGGFIRDMAPFFENFGLELRSKYPYREQAAQCPYEEEYDLRRAGFLRTGLRQQIEVPVASFPEVLKFSPIIINIATTPEFLHYGGGVHKTSCGEFGMHSMLLVGHGRENGLEYWLIRNSHGTKWGEQGYYKMAKVSNCILPEVGWIYGTRNAKKLDLIVDENKHYSDARVVEHYLKFM